METSLPIRLLTTPPDDETVQLRRALVQAIGDPVINTLLIGLEEADTTWDAPWRLYGLCVDYDDGEESDSKEARVHFTWMQFEDSGSGHPIDTWCGHYAPLGVIGLALISDSEDSDRPSKEISERLTLMVMADGRTDAVLLDRQGTVSSLSEPIEGRLVDAMLTLLRAPVPLRVDPREIALSLLIDVAHLYPDPSGFLPLALSDPVALAWLPQDEDETVEHWDTGEVLDDIDAYNALGEEIERRLKAGEPDYLPDELINRYSPEVAARSLVGNMAFQVSFRGSEALFDWLEPNAIVNTFAERRFSNGIDIELLLTKHPGHSAVKHLVSHRVGLWQ